MFKLSRTKKLKIYLFLKIAIKSYYANNNNQESYNMSLKHSNKNNFIKKSIRVSGKKYKENKVFW